MLETVPVGGEEDKGKRPGTIAEPRTPAVGAKCCCYEKEDSEV